MRSIWPDICHLFFYKGKLGWELFKKTPCMVNRFKRIITVKKIFLLFLYLFYKGFLTFRFWYVKTIVNLQVLCLLGPKVGMTEIKKTLVFSIVFTIPRPLAGLPLAGRPRTANLSSC